MTDEDPKMKALAKLDEVTADFEAGEADQERRRERVHAAIVEALQAGAGPSEIERHSPYDRQHVNRIRVAAGIPPKRAATVQRIPKKRAK